MLGKLISSAKGNVQPLGTLELVKAKIFYKDNDNDNDNNDNDNNFI